MDKPLVSVIIPLYNSEKYVAETILSAMQQTWPNKEIIIVDDGSTDNSLAIAKEFAAEKVKVFTQENKGASAARNRGLHEAKGQFIQFLDADDLLSANKIEEQLRVLEKYPDHLCTSNTVYFFDDNLKAVDSVPKPFNQESYKPVDFIIKQYGGNLPDNGFGGIITIHSWLSPRHIIDKAGSWDEELSVDDDGEFFCRVILASQGIVNSNNTTNYYRKHSKGNSLSGQLTGKGFKSMIRSVDLKYDYILSTGQAAPERLNAIFSKFYWGAGVAAYPKYRALSAYAIQKAKELKFNGQKYRAGPISTYLSKIIGWRLIRILSYIRYGF